MSCTLGHVVTPVGQKSTSRGLSLTAEQAQGSWLIALDRGINENARNGGKDLRRYERAEKKGPEKLKAMGSKGDQ